MTERRIGEAPPCTCSGCKPESYLVCEFCKQPYPKWDRLAPRPFCSQRCRDGKPPVQLGFWTICTKENKK